MMLRVERDQMISAPAPDGPDQAFNMSVLPGRAERGGPVLDAHGSHGGRHRRRLTNALRAKRPQREVITSELMRGRRGRTKERFPKGFRTWKPYLRLTPQP
jgi:hypothetical protein